MSKFISIISFISILIILPVHAKSYLTERIFLSGKGPSDAKAWSFKCSKGRNCGKWSQIKVPSNWEQQGFGGYDYGFTKSEDKHNETGHYKTSFYVPENWKGRNVRIVFEGVMTETSVKVNDQLVGMPNFGAYQPFRYKLNEVLKYGEQNKLEVFVKKKPSNHNLDEAERSADYWVFGGIFRPVYIESLPKAFINRIAIDAKANGHVQLEVYPQAHYAYKHYDDSDVLYDEVSAQIETLNDIPVGVPIVQKALGGKSRFRLTTQITSPNTWSPEFPNLYKVRVRLKKKGTVVHEYQEKFGFRTIEFKANDGLYLNGNKIMVKGVNRNGFDSDHGRAIDPDRAWQDARDIKLMNANLVRSHLPPSKAFMEACDELGLLYIMELANWQLPYIDTPVARNIAYEIVTFYQNHPSIIMWANGNEGGFNFEVDDVYQLVDLQKRVLIHPWSLFEGIDTFHYPNYSQLSEKLAGSNVVMPTEFLHGLHDGGHGAGLDDFWTAMSNSDVGAGGALWCWADAAIKRTDLNNKLDTYGNKSADGIVGPYGEKEASYFTVREIWSPIQVIFTQFDSGNQVHLKNLYYETNLKDIRFKWRLYKYPNPTLAESGQIITSQGELMGPSIEPGGLGVLKLNLPANYSTNDAIQLSAYTKSGRQIMSWSWPFQEKLLAATEKSYPIELISNNPITLKVGKQTWSFSAETGRLLNVKASGIDLGLTEGPILYAGTKSAEINSGKNKSLNWKVKANFSGDNYIINASSTGGSYFRWTIDPQSRIKLDYNFTQLKDKLSYAAVGFNLNEALVQSKTWLGNGPYRVWSNRMKGPEFGLWSNNYNDTRTGIQWGQPEFKGIFSQVDWMNLSLNSGHSLLIAPSGFADVGVMRPKFAEGLKDENSFDGPVRAWWHYPSSGNLHLFHKLPAVGTKFANAFELGPQGQPQKIDGNLTGGVIFKFTN